MIYENMRGTRVNTDQRKPEWFQTKNHTAQSFHVGQVSKNVRIAIFS